MNDTGAPALGRWNGSMPPLGYRHTWIGQLCMLGDAWIIPFTHTAEAVATLVGCIYVRQRPAVATNRSVPCRARVTDRHSRPFTVPSEAQVGWSRVGW